MNKNHIKSLAWSATTAVSLTAWVSLREEAFWWSLLAVAVLGYCIGVAGSRIFPVEGKE